MGDLPLGVEDRVVRRRKIDLYADLEDVQLDLNHLKMGSENRFFERSFGWFISSSGVPWSHEWVTHPRGLRMG